MKSVLLAASYFVFETLGFGLKAGLVMHPDLNNFADLFKNDIIISICVCICICVKCQVFKILTNIKYGSGSVASTGALKCLSRLEEISMKCHAAKKIGF